MQLAFDAFATGAPGGNFGSGYGGGYSGGAMKGAGYGQRAAGPYGGKN